VDFHFVLKYFVSLHFTLNLFCNMKTDTIDEDAFVNRTPRSIEDIKASYPDEWILLGNPVRRNEREMDILSGVVLYHSPDKREVCYLGKPLVKNYNRVSLFFNRVTPRPKRAAIVSIYSTLKPLKQ